MRSFNIPSNQDTVLQGTAISTVPGFLPTGVTPDQRAGIAREKTGKKATVMRDLDFAAFREQTEANGRRVAALRDKFFARSVVRYGRRSPLSDCRLP
jgi:hypothetical protein